jgi:two-component system, OmpR family, response regulator MprA
MTRVLVVDDSETVLLMLQRRLETAGYEVATAADGQGALDGVAADPSPDVVLLDAMMPGMSGIDALREIRASGDKTPILIVSAYRYGEEPEEALRLGADGCIPKPFEWDDLVGRIEELTKT